MSCPPTQRLAHDLDTVSNLGNGQATKILFPFEFTRLMEGASEYLGTARTIPDRSLNTLDELEKRIGTIDDVLGPIPKQEELLTEIKSIEDEIKAESDESTAMVGPYQAPGKSASVAAPTLPDPEDLRRPTTAPATGTLPPATSSGAPPNVSPTDPKKRPASPPS